MRVTATIAMADGSRVDFGTAVPQEVRGYARWLRDLVAADPQDTFSHAFAGQVLSGRYADVVMLRQHVVPASADLTRLYAVWLDRQCAAKDTAGAAGRVRS